MYSRAFKRFAKKNADLNIPLQYSDEALTFVRMLPPHDRTAGTVAGRLIHEVLALVPGDDKLGVELEHHTGGRNINPLI